MPIATITFGNVNGPDASLRLSVFLVSRPYQRELLGKVRKVSGTIPFAIGQTDSSGKLYIQTVELMDGDLILAQMHRTYRGSKIADGIVFAEARSNGPLYNVIGKMIAVPRHNNLNNVQILSTNCDLLSFDEVRERGYAFPEHFDSIFGDKEELEMLFDIRKLRDESAPAPKVEKLVNSAGDTIAVVKDMQPRRVIRVRR